MNKNLKKAKRIYNRYLVKPINNAINTVEDSIQEGIDYSTKKIESANKEINKVLNNVGKEINHTLDNTGKDFENLIKNTEKQFDNTGKQINKAVNDVNREINKNIKLLATDLYGNSEEDDLIPGDIVSVNRFPLPYYHFAVYIGDHKVIHFASKTRDWGGKITIHEAPFSQFMQNSKYFKIVRFSEKNKKSKKLFTVPLFNLTCSIITIPTNYLFNPKLNKTYHLYTPEETVERAKLIVKQLKYDKNHVATFNNGHYNLIFNNCEHFALWCKTGIKESKQIDAIIKKIFPINQRIKIDIKKKRK